MLTGIIAFALGVHGQHLNISDAERATLSSPRSLRVGETISGKINRGERATYSIVLSQGDAALVDVEQIDADLACSVSPPGNGLPIVQIDREDRLGRSEVISFVAETPGTYLIEITAKYQKPQTASYSVHLNAARAANSEQLVRFSIDRAITKAYREREQGRPKAAAEFAEDALLKARKEWGASTSLGLVINETAMFAYWNGNVKKFLSLAEEAWTLFDPLPVDDQARLRAQENLAFGYRMSGDLSRSETLSELLLRTRTQLLGEEHPSLAPVLAELAVAKRAKGDYVAAGNLSRRSLSIREAWLGPEHLDVVLSLQNLGAISYAMGDTQAYLHFTERALAIRRKNLPPGHPDLARTLMDIGSVRTDLHDFEKAEELLKESLVIRDAALGSEHPMTVLSRFSLASLYQQQGDLARAKVIFDDVLQLLPTIESSFSRSQAALILQGLGGFYTAAGEFERSEAILRRTLDERIGLNGPDGLEVGRSCDDLARLYAKTGRVSEALRFQERANSIAEKHLQTLLKRGSEQQKLNLIEAFELGLNQTVSLHADVSPVSPVAASLAVETILNRKGRVLDALLATQARMSTEADGDGKIKARLAEINSKLSGELMGRSSLVGTDAWKASIEQLIDERREIYRASGRNAEEDIGSKVELTAVRAAIPADSALIEIKTYKPFGNLYRFGEEEIVAYILRREGPIGWVKLGKAREIGALADQFRRAIRDPNTDVSDVLAELSRRIARPIVERSGGATRLILSPDGPINLIPIQALLDTDGRYLAERFTVSYITSGRDLIRSADRAGSSGASAVLADPNFGLPAAGASAKSLLPAYFQPLRSTRREADLIASMFPDTLKYTGSDALEGSLKAMVKPRLLHIATHGFFLTDDPGGGEKRSSFWKPEFQLFRSGLVFANVNARPTTGDDGVLTALEASALDLRGTRLVVLSACDTGVGAVRNGEGVYGLRRAFTIAGAEALIMSLWPVSDQATLELMTGYYKNLRKGLGRADSLRSIQVEMMRKPGRSHPYYWASFIHAGSWTPI